MRAGRAQTNEIIDLHCRKQEHRNDSKTPYVQHNGPLTPVATNRCPLPNPHHCESWQAVAAAGTEAATAAAAAARTAAAAAAARAAERAAAAVICPETLASGTTATEARAVEQPAEEQTAATAITIRV